MSLKYAPSHSAEGPAAEPGGGGAERRPPHAIERQFYIDNLLVRIHLIIVMIWWTGLAPWEFEFPLPGSLISNTVEWWQRDRRQNLAAGVQSDDRLRPYIKRKFAELQNTAQVSLLLLIHYSQA